MLHSNIVKIIVADSCKLIKEGIITILNSFPNFLVIDEAENETELIEKVLKYQPDLLIVDADLTPNSGLETFIKLRSQSIGFKTLFVSYFDTTLDQQIVSQAGGNGLVSKYISSNELAYAINIIMSGEPYFPKNISVKHNDNEQQSYSSSNNDHNENSDILTKKETEILTLIAQGMTSSEIAIKIFVSKRTIDTHRMHILQKLNLKSSSALMKFACENVNLLGTNST